MDDRARLPAFAARKKFPLAEKFFVFPLPYFRNTEGFNYRLLNDLAAILTSACDRRNEAMTYTDWRSPIAYDRARDMEPSGLAWECLRRNPDYHRNHRELKHSQPDPLMITMFRRRWGLCFCG
jgi:hypothetical protein